MTSDPALILGWLVVGWLVGAVAGLVALSLISADEPSAAAPPRVAKLGPLGNDWQLQAATAVSFAVLAGVHGLGLKLVVYSAYALVLLLVLIVDARSRYVYNVVAYPAIIAGVLLTPFASGQALWSGAAGALVGAAVMMALRLIGRWRYGGQEAIASGDVTIAAMMGAMAGLVEVLPALLLGAVLGGVFAVAVAAMRRSFGGTMPYGPGLCLGALIMLAIGR